MWNEIFTEEDISNLMGLFGDFHDSCIKEIRYVSGAFVNHNLSMNPVNNMRMVDMVVQRQYRNPMAIVIRFTGVKMLHLAPHDDKYTCEIHGASMFIKNENIYWADCCEAINEIESYDGTWICADKAQWRIIDECIGSNNVFDAKYEF